VSPRKSKIIGEKGERAKRYLFGRRRKGNLLKEERKLFKGKRNFFKEGKETC
jgi:hypothetical protein